MTYAYLSHFFCLSSFLSGCVLRRCHLLEAQQDRNHSLSFYLCGRGPVPRQQPGCRAVALWVRTVSFSSLVCALLSHLIVVGSIAVQIRHVLPFLDTLSEHLCFLCYLSVRSYVPYEASSAPTVVPTAAPTQAPYENVRVIRRPSHYVVFGKSSFSLLFLFFFFFWLQGFVYVNFYEEAGCVGNIVSVEGRQTGVCLQAYGDLNSATVTGSYIFTCAGGTSSCLF